MNNDIHGKDNRAAGRDFHEGNIQVDQLIGRDVLNITIPASQTTKHRLLVPAQRKQLNQLVKEVTEISGEEGFVIWQRVHAEIGVKSIDEITVNQYQTSLNYLQAMLDKHRESGACKALMHQLLKKTPNNNDRQKLYEYCHIAFGTRHLAELTKSQLQQSLGWLCNEQGEAEKTKQPDLGRLSLSEIIRQYPKEFFCIFLIGGLLGAFIF